jgi:hypothetical protein
MKDVNILQRMWHLITASTNACDGAQGLAPAHTLKHYSGYISAPFLA